MRDLDLISKQEQQNFLNSIEHILCDVDGVLWNPIAPIPGTQNAIRSLKKIDKKVTLVSNNCTKSLDFYYNQLKSAGFDVEEDDLITPAMAMVSYFKKLNFDKEIYVIGSTALKKELEKSGFKIAEDGPDRVREALPDFARACTTDNENVGAVIIDLDINLNYVKLQKAATYLKRSEVIFVSGAPDIKMALGHNHVVLGPGYFHKILEDMTERTPHALAKPSPYFNDFITEKLEIKDPSKILFVGDSISEDMGFATKCGYKKLLVLSGLSRKDSIANWTFPEEYKPDFYVDSLKTMDDIIQRIFLNKL